MNKQELYEEIRDAAFDTRKAINNTARPMPYVERMKNILYNRMDEIEETLKFAAEAEKQIAVLELELNDAEAELSEKDKQIAELTAPKTTTKKKTSGAANG